MNNSNNKRTSDTAFIKLWFDFHTHTYTCKHACVFKYVSVFECVCVCVSMCICSKLLPHIIDGATTRRDIPKAPFKNDLHFRLISMRSYAITLQSMTACSLCVSYSQHCGFCFLKLVNFIQYPFKPFQHSISR